MAAERLESDGALDARLKQLRRGDEVIHPLSPTELNGGDWWDGEREWPRALVSGLLEPRRGYRFRPENLALGALLGGLESKRVIDLGTGSGSLLLIALAFLEPVRALGLELQSTAIERLERTLEAHGRRNVVIEQGDLRELACLQRAESSLGGKADLVVMNPPFFPEGWGRASSNEDVHHSTHAVHGDVAAFLQAAVTVSSDDAKIFVVFDAARLASLFAAAAKVVLEPDRIVMIPNRHQATQADVPYRVWVRFRRGEMLSTW